jgi:hypothetical protein
MPIFSPSTNDGLRALGTGDESQLDSLFKPLRSELATWLKKRGIKGPEAATLATNAIGEHLLAIRKILAQGETVTNAAGLLKTIAHRRYTDHWRVHGSEDQSAVRKRKSLLRSYREAGYLSSRPALFFRFPWLAVNEGGKWKDGDEVYCFYYGPGRFELDEDRLIWLPVLHDGLILIRLGWWTDGID